MNKITENISEMSMYFALMLQEGKIKFPEEDAVSVRDEFKENVAIWAGNFERLYDGKAPYPDAIEIFLLHCLKEEGWIEETDAETDAKNYGYTFEVMQRLTFLDAAYRFAVEGKSVYLLYADNTEAGADSLESIAKHQTNGGLFGYELPVVDVRFIMNDRFFEDNWAESYLVKAKIVAGTPHLVSDLQEISNRLYKNAELACGDEGIKQILQMYQAEHPHVLKEYRIEFVPCVCFGMLVEG
jgi:hypothetical protein